MAFVGDDCPGEPHVSDEYLEGDPAAASGGEFPLPRPFLVQVLKSYNSQQSCSQALKLCLRGEIEPMRARTVERRQMA